MSEFLLCFRDTHFAKRLSPEQIQTVTTKWIVWMERLRKEGKNKDSRPLETEVTLILKKNGRTLTNRVLPRPKLATTGYMLLRVECLAQAVEIAKTCPILDYGSTIMIQPVARIEGGVMANFPEAPR